MARLQKSFNIFSTEGIKFLLLELVIVFLGVYLAFLFQNYSEQRKIDSEREKILIGLKEDLEYFRIYFPDFAGSEQAKEWYTIVQKGEYINFHSWRFIQPQYDYISIEYALSAGAEVIDFETNSATAEIYQELKKLEHVEGILTELAMKYVAIPDGYKNDPQIEMARSNNLLNFQRFVQRYSDRAGIMLRIAKMSAEQLPAINKNFSNSKLKEIELLLIQKNVTVESDQQIEFFVNTLNQFFPNLSKEEIRSTLQ